MKLAIDQIQLVAKALNEARRKEAVEAVSRQFARLESHMRDIKNSIDRAASDPHASFDVCSMRNALGSLSDMVQAASADKIGEFDFYLALREGGLIAE